MADAVSTSTITATVLDLLDQPVTDGTVVTFTTTLRRLGTGHWVTGTTAGGVVTATLTSGTTPGTAMITAWADLKFGLTYVTFTPTGTPTPTPAPTATPTATPVARLFVPLVTKGFH
ncbi:MAG: invasin domain 3-containing protein [Anaerolineae bacterium]